MFVPDVKRGFITNTVFLFVFCYFLHLYGTSFFQELSSPQVMCVDFSCRLRKVSSNLEKHIKRFETSYQRQKSFKCSAIKLPMLETMDVMGIKVI